LASGWSERKPFEKRHHDPPELAWAGPLPAPSAPDEPSELSRPDESSLPPEELPEELSVVAVEVFAVVVSFEASERAAAAIAIVPTTATIAKPDVTAAVVRWAVSRSFIGFSCRLLS
jgi:hypothetical protein